MSKPVYEIRTFNLKGEKLFTFKLIPELEEVNEPHSSTYFRYKENKERYSFNHLVQLTTNIDEYPKSKLFNSSIEKLPYFADVTEDLPGYVKFTPKTFHNCQLLSEKHGGYLQFYHEPTGEVLRIAINSNTYIPVKV